MIISHRHGVADIHADLSRPAPHARYFGAKEGREEWISVNIEAAHVSVVGFEGSNVETRVELRHRPHGSVHLPVAHARALYESLGKALDAAVPAVTLVSLDEEFTASLERQSDWYREHAR